MRIKLIILMLLVFSGWGFGQNNYLAFSCGYGSYSMSDLKKYQDFNLSGINPEIPAKLLENFPSNLYYQANWSFDINEKYGMGFCLGFHSTGSQIQYADYTGELSYRIITDAFTCGLTLNRKILTFKNISIKLNTQFLLYSSAAKFKYSLVVWDEKKSNSYKLESVSPAIEPGCLIDYKFKFITVGLQMGYLFDAGAKLYYNYSDSQPANIYPYGVLKTNWSGFRFGLITGINF